MWAGCCALRTYMDDNLSSFSCLVQVAVACTYMYYCTRSLNPCSLLIPGLGEVEGEEGSIGSIASPRSVPQTAERGLWRASESSEEGRQQLPLLILLDLIHCHNHLHPLLPSLLPSLPPPPLPPPPHPPPSTLPPSTLPPSKLTSMPLSRSGEMEVRLSMSVWL